MERDTKRYHIRLWDIGGGDVVGGVHMDALRFSGQHVSSDFESIEKDFDNMCRAIAKSQKHGHWKVMEDAIDLQGFRL